MLGTSFDTVVCVTTQSVYSFPTPGTVFRHYLVRESTELKVFFFLLPHRLRLTHTVVLRKKYYAKADPTRCCHQVPQSTTDTLKESLNAQVLRLHAPTMSGFRSV